jgi:hypothetical protein
MPLCVAEHADGWSPYGTVGFRQTLGIQLGCVLCDGTVASSFGGSARRLVRRPTAWIVPAPASLETRQGNAALLQTDADSTRIFAPLDKTRCPPFAGQQHSSRVWRRPGTPQSLKKSESALVLRKTLGVVNCGLREPPLSSRPNSLTIPVRKGFRDGI